MSGQRVYGSVVYDGLRHEASGVIDGTFAKKKGGWDTYTICGKYLALAVETDESLVISCLRCIGRKRASSGDYRDILRGMTFDSMHIDEPMDYIKSTTFIDESFVFAPADQTTVINAIGETVKAGATRGCVVGTPSDLPLPSDEGHPASRR